VDIHKSIAFIERKGSSLEKARVHCILDGEKPQPEIIQGFHDLQNDDGGFPFGLVRGNLSTLNETTVALWWMEELDLLSSPAARKAFSFLLANQYEDGSWEESPQAAQYDLPPWIELGDQKTKLYLSAYASYWLAVGGYIKPPAFRKALHFLIRSQDQTGRFFGYLHTTWIAVGVFLLAGERYASIASRGIELLSARAMAEWVDSQLAWALDCLSRGGLPKSHPYVKKCLDELVRRQGRDGSWASEDGEASSVGATIQALKVLKRYGLITSELAD